MIAKTFEWYRIVSPTPSTQSVETRTQAATELIAELSEQNPTTLLALVQGIARQFDGTSTETDTIEWLLRTLKKHDPAVSENLLENELELRCLASIVLGELLHRSKGEPNELATVAAAAFISAMNMRLLPEQRYLRAMIEELSKMALGAIDQAAEARRERVDVKRIEDGKIDDEEDDDGSADQQLIAHLQDQIASLADNASMDREEIEMLWFVTTGFSRTKKRAFSDLSISVAAVHAALEFHQVLLIPSPLNCFEMLTEIVERKRTPKLLKPISVSEHIAQWSSEEWGAIAVETSPEANLVSNFPVVFPVHWIANRMQQIRCAPSWTEFNRITQLKADAELSAAQLGRQLLHEEIVLALMGKSNE